MTDNELIPYRSSNSNDIEVNSKSNPLSKKRSSIKWVQKISQSTRKSVTKKSTVEIELETTVENMISRAEIHRKSNRPLIKLKDFDNDTQFCRCCFLPAEDGKYLRTCGLCENTDKFAYYGRGTSLFFSYFRFSILISALALCSMAIPSFFLNNHYTNQLIDTCSKIYAIKGENISSDFPDCIDFINIKGVSEYFIKEGDWEFKYDGLNLKYYRKVYQEIVGSDDSVDKILINYHITTFMALVSLFLINLLYIILLYNINRQHDLSINSPSDYTIIISNLHSAFKIFLKNITKINDIIRRINANNNDLLTQNIKLINTQDLEFKAGIKECQKELEILGLKDYPKDKEINILEGFNNFIKNKICVGTNGDKLEYFNICKINICYKIDEYMKIEEKIQELKRKIYKVKRQKYQIKKNYELHLKDDERRYFYNPLPDFIGNLFNCGICEKFETLSDILKEKKELEIKLSELLEQTENLTEDNFSGAVFVTFNKIDEAERFLAPYPKNLIMSIFNGIKNLKYYLCGCCVDKEKKELFFLNRNLGIKEAPEPEDVIFENLQYSSFKRFIRTVLVYFLSLIIIFISFIIILFLTDYQNQKMKNNTNNNVVKYGISIAVTLIISVINSIFQFILEFLTKNEKQISNTDYYLSFSIKLTIFTFLNSGVIPLISSYYYSESKYDLLLTNMLTLFLSNSFLTPIMWTINFELLKKGFKICLIKRGINNEKYTQMELNKIYELLDMNLSYKYSYIFKTLLMSFLYMPIFPMSIAISFLGFLFGYFLEKFNFSKMYRRPEMLNSKICEFYSNYFVINFFMLCLGNYIFLRDNNQSNIFCISNFIIFGILIIIPYNQIFVCDFIDIKESTLKTKEYEEYYFQLFNDYERINPMTKKEAIKRFFGNLKKDGSITESDYKLICNNIDKVNLMETYYRARKKFSDSLLLKIFMNIPDVSHKKELKGKVSFIEKLKEISKNNKTKMLNLLLSNMNHNNEHFDNYHLKEVNEIDIDNKDNENKEPRSSIRELNNNVLLNFSSNVNSNNNNIFTNNINTNTNTSNNEQLEEDKKREKKRARLSKKNMEIFKHLIRMEQRKILHYYKNPILFLIKRMCEGIIVHNNEKQEENINNLSIINEDDSIHESNK